jgi:ATP-binding cassette subfamily B protein
MWRIIKRFLGLVLPYKKHFFLALFSVLLLSVLGPLRPYLIGKAVDQYIIQTTDSKRLLFALLGVFILLIIETLVVWLATYFSNFLAQTIIKTLRVRIYQKILGFKTSFFDKTPVGNLVTRVVSDVEAIYEVFSAGLMEIAGDLLSLLAILSFMFYVDWKLSLLTLIPIPILIFATKIFAKAMKTSFQMERTQVAKLNTFIQEHLMGLTLIQWFNREKKSYEAFKEINKNHRDAHIKAVWANSIFFPVVELLSSLSIAFLLVWGALMVEGKSQTQISALFGNIIAFTLWINQLYRPIRQLADKFNILQRGVVRAERIFEIMDNEEEPQWDQGTQTVFENGPIQFNNVSFAYQKDVTLFNRLNATLPNGKITAFVGATGSGKTTLVNLIGRFYELNQGEITINGVDIRTYALSTLHREIGYVQQDVFLFSDTIHNNIALGNSEITRARIIETAKAIGAHSFIMNLPNTYDYVIGERGGALSVGQRQLLSFIRVMVYNPSILILDEATSSVDSESELLIQNAIHEMTKNRTSIIIAHRLSTIKKAHTIFVMESGSIVEQGNHDSLLQLKGVYARLFEKQFKSQYASEV